MTTRPHKPRLNNLFVLAIAWAAITLVAARRPTQVTTPPDIAGRVVVQHGPTGDDTANIQAAIDTVARTGGVVVFPAGVYRHTGLTGRANVHLKGIHVGAVKLDYTPDTGDGITLVTDPDNFMISDLVLTSSGRSTGWGIRAKGGTQRSLRIERVSVNGFTNGILLPNTLSVSIRECRIGHTYPNSPRGIGLQLGDGRKVGGNGVTVEDCYFSSLDKAIVTYVQACLVSRPIIELCHTGIETHGITSILAPWYDGTTDEAHVSVQPNTIGGGSSGTGVLLFGYGSSGWKMKYGSKAERNRSLILPERLDFKPGEDPSSPRGVTFGQVVIDRDGVVHAREFRKLPD
ncbi:MAG: glycosyl hydrolase family 28-related protein [Planctomycetota bacterium]|nr:glycosyl hydrolase family 28-related protein [Planctomycetota bacterium]